MVGKEGEILPDWNVESNWWIEIKRNIDMDEDGTSSSLIQNASASFVINVWLISMKEILLNAIEFNSKSIE